MKSGLFIFIFVFAWIVCNGFERVIVSQFSVTSNNSSKDFIRLSRSVILLSPEYFQSATIIGCYYDGNINEKSHLLTDHIILMKGVTYGNLQLGNDWRNFICGLQVADYLFSKGHYDTEILFIGSTLFIPGANSITEYFSDDLPNWNFCCDPKILHNPTDRGSCELDLYRFKSRLGAPMLNIIKALRYRNVTANEALQIVLSQLHVTTSYIVSNTVLRPITYTGTDMMTASSVNSIIDNGNNLRLVSFIEFDGVNHKLSIDSQLCDLQLYVEWPEFGSIPIIVNGLQSVYENETLRLQLTGCSDIPVRDASIKTLQDIPAINQVEVNRRVFDCIMFFDEISLLLLRLELLNDIVDIHIIVEARKTFTGKPKSLYFQENQHMFQDYLHKIIVITIEDLLTPTLVGDVWKNEYNSRNELVRGLIAAGATDDDIVIVQDTDEIINPKAILQLKSILNYNDYERSNIPSKDQHLLPEFYKLFQKQFLYNFNCSLEDNTGKYSHSSIASIREAKRISRLSVLINHNYNNNNEALENIQINLIDTRNFMQNSPLFPVQNMLTPAGVHMSFFESIDRIKRKLESYSHQNFASQFHDGANDVGGNFNLSNSDVLPVGEVSVDSLRQRIQKGEVINFKHKMANVLCSNSETKSNITDEFELLIREKWSRIAVSDDIVEVIV